MKKIIKFTPLDAYFFGVKGINEDGTDNYFLHSLKMPQATTILGALRFILLQNAGTDVFHQNKIVDNGKATNIIGKESFIFNKSGQDFGKIRSVSPLFLLDENNQIAIRAPHIDDKEKLFFEDAKPYPSIKNLNPKNLSYTLFSNGLEESEVFTKIESVHNRKNNRPENQEESFYKKNSFQLKQGYGFAVEIMLSDDAKLPENGLVRLGGENHYFKYEVMDDRNIDWTTLLQPYAHNQLHKLVLIADTYIKEGLDNKDFLFAATTTVEMRQLISSVDTNNYYAVAAGNTSGSLNRSELLHLLSAGSCFYFEDNNQLTKFEKKLNNADLQKVGYNHFVSLKPKNN